MALARNNRIVSFGPPPGTPPVSEAGAVVGPAPAPVPGGARPFVPDNSAISKALMQAGVNTSPVSSPLEAFGRPLQAILGQYLQGQQAIGENKDEAWKNDVLASALVKARNGDYQGAAVDANRAGSTALAQALMGKMLEAPKAPVDRNRNVDWTDPGTGNTSRMEVTEQYNPDTKAYDTTGWASRDPAKPAEADPASWREYQLAKTKDGFTGTYAEWQHPAPKNNDPTSVDEFKFAQQNGYKGTYEDWVKTKAPSTTINVGPNGTDYGAPPPGMAWVRDQNGKIKMDDRDLPMAGTIKGTSQYDAEQKALNAGTNRAQHANIRADIVGQDVDRALTLLNTNNWLPTAGWGAVLAGVPGSPQKDFHELVGTIKANIGIDELQQMRMESPTGAALGNVTERENAMLQSLLGSLEQAQSKEQLRQNLQRVKDRFNIIVYGDVNGGPNIVPVPKQEAGPQYPTITTQDQYNALQPGTKYKDEDGNIATKPSGPISGRMK